MLHLSMGKNIPKKFQQINSLNSAESRIRLSIIVSSIEEMKKRLRPYELDQVTTDVTDRYLAYLESSCSSLRELSRRAPWAVILGEITLSKLQGAYGKVIPPETFDHGISAHDDLREQIARMIDQIKLRQETSQVLDLQSDTLIQETCSAIVTYVVSMKTTNPAHYYDVIEREIRYVTDLATSQDGLGDDAALIRALRTLYSKMTKYVRRVSMTN